MLIYGQTMYGKVDEVEGFCWVSTQFFHLYFVPIIPLGSYIVTGEEGDDIQGLKVPLSGKSVGIAYLQGACIVAIIVGLILGIVGEVPPYLSWGAFALGIATFIGVRFIPGVRIASWPRAQQIANQIGLVEEGRVLLGMQYGKIDPRSAEKQLEALAEQREQEYIKDEERKAENRAAREAVLEERRAKAQASRDKKQEKNAELRAKAPKKRARTRD